MVMSTNEDQEKQQQQQQQAPVLSSITTTSMNKNKHASSSSVSLDNENNVNNINNINDDKGQDENNNDDDQNIITENEEDSSADYYEQRVKLPRITLCCGGNCDCDPSCDCGCQALPKLIQTTPQLQQLQGQTQPLGQQHPIATATAPLLSSLPLSKTTTSSNLQPVRQQQQQQSVGQGRNGSNTTKTKTNKTKGSSSSKHADPFVERYSNAMNSRDIHEIESLFSSFSTSSSQLVYIARFWSRESIHAEPPLNPLGLYNYVHLCGVVDIVNYHRVLFSLVPDLFLSGPLGCRNCKKKAGGGGGHAKVNISLAKLQMSGNVVASLTVPIGQTASTSTSTTSTAGMATSIVTPTTSPRHSLPPQSIFDNTTTTGMSSPTRSTAVVETVHHDCCQRSSDLVDLRRRLLAEDYFAAVSKPFHCSNSFRSKIPPEEVIVQTPVIQRKEGEEETVALALLRLAESSGLVAKHPCQFGPLANRGGCTISSACCAAKDNFDKTTTTEYHCCSVSQECCDERDIPSNSTTSNTILMNTKVLARLPFKVSVLFIFHYRKDDPSQLVRIEAQYYEPKDGAAAV